MMGPRTFRLAGAILTGLLVTAAVTWDLGLQHWLARMTGSENTPGTPPNYNFHSGFGSIILPPFLNGLALAAVIWWHHTCAVDGCFRYAKRVTAAHERACRHHYPDQDRTAEGLRRRHHLYLGQRPGPG